MNPIPPEIDSLLEDGDRVLDYDRAEGDDFYDLYDLVYTRRRPTDGELQEIAGLLQDTGSLVVLSGSDRNMERYFTTVGFVGSVAVGQGPKEPEESRINAEKRRRQR